MNSRLLSVLCLSALLGFSSCTNSSNITLDYVPPEGQVLRGAPDFSVGAFANKRGIESHRLGRVNLPIGVPLEMVNSDIPVETLVANAMAHALHARGMLTEGNQAHYLITGDVLNLDAQMVVRPSAYVKVRVNVVEMDSGRVLFSKVYESERISSAYRPGTGSPVPLLQELTSRALQDVVDKAVDDPALRSQLGGRGFRPRYSSGML